MQDTHQKGGPDMSKQQGYKLDKKEESSRFSGKKYYRQDLEGMSVYQLREIAKRERIIEAIVNPLDKELLVHTILRYRGAENALLIREYEQEAYERLEDVFHHITFQEDKDLQPDCSARITVYDGLAMDYYDELTLQYDPALVGTNAFVLDSEQNLCCVFNIEAKGREKKYLYMRKAAELPCHEAKIKKYQLVFLNRKISEAFFHFYHGQMEFLTENAVGANLNISAAGVPLLDFTVKQPDVLKTPAAIDFGTSNTVAGALYIDNSLANRKAGLHREKVRYATFFDPQHDYLETNLLPSVIAVYSLEDPEHPEYRFGYEALKMAAGSYTDESLCIFYDIKRWISDYEREEELTDKLGRRLFVKRKDILRGFLLYMIHALENRTKCIVKKIHMSNPVKQTHKFQRMFQEILPEYALERRDMVDEGVSVLYNTISEMIDNNLVQRSREMKALIIDCGGGTTDISSCIFKVEDKRVAYDIDIETGYENGSTDFGGNNLTYRIMQLLKLRLLESLRKQYQEHFLQDSWWVQKEFYGQKESFDRYAAAKVAAIPSTHVLLEPFNMDIFRYVDEVGTEPIYREFERAYQLAEDVLPTRFKEWERQTRDEYFQVKNNFYYLFQLAEQVKQALFENSLVFEVLLEVESNHDPASRDKLDLYLQKVQEDGNRIYLPLDKWKLTICSHEGLNALNNLPDISLSIFEAERLLCPDIYSMVHRFMNPLYESGELEDYNIIKLSGQSCKIDLFRTALKEFVPGKVIKSRKRQDQGNESNELKMSCIDGVLKYLRDKNFGYADVTIHNRTPHLPYILTGFTHKGEEVLLIHGGKEITHGLLSRNMDDLTLELYLKDEQDKLRYQFTYYCTLEEFSVKTQEEIEQIYGGNIPQDDTDNIVDREVKFFIWAEPMEWGFVVVPVYREGENMNIGREQFYSFEDEEWVMSFFDGLK